jgi:hypothetical protein
MPDTDVSPQGVRSDLPTDWRQLLDEHARLLEENERLQQQRQELTDLLYRLPHSCDCKACRDLWQQVRVVL